MSESQQQERYVITHPEMGIYLGQWIGLGFWSKLDPVGQPAAITFASIAEAEEFMASWDNGRPADASTAAVIADDGEFATIAACVRAGLEGWLDECTPVVNHSPC